MPDEIPEQKPKLSVVVCVVSDAEHLQGCLDSLKQQVDAPITEIIVPYLAKEIEIKELAAIYPTVIFHPVERAHTPIDIDSFSREHHDELRAIGLCLARGDIIALIEDHGRAEKFWAKNIIQAHKNPHPAIGGAIENGVDRLLNWAVYYCDFGRYQNPLQEGPTYYISDANISYKRNDLETIKEIWRETFHETTVNTALMKQGKELRISPDIIVYQHRKNLILLSTLHERYIWGRSFAGTRANDLSFLKRMVLTILSPALPFILTFRKAREVIRKRRLIGKFIKCLPLIFLLCCCWSIGEFMGYLTGRQNKFIVKSS